MDIVAVAERWGLPPSTAITCSKNPKDRCKLTYPNKYLELSMFIDKYHTENILNSHMISTFHLGTVRHCHCQAPPQPTTTTLSRRHHHSSMPNIWLDFVLICLYTFYACISMCLSLLPHCLGIYSTICLSIWVSISHFWFSLFRKDLRSFLGSCIYNFFESPILPNRNCSK